MTLRSGSFAWLLRHELRLSLRGTGKRGAWARRAIPMLLLVALPVLGGVALAIVIALARRPGTMSPHYSPPIYALLGVFTAGVFAVMISTAAIAVLRTFRDRADLDLLLAAPVPPARVLAAKSVGVAASVAAPFMVLVAPFTLASAVLGHPRWLGAVAMVLADAVAATAVALGVTAAMFATIGPRRARTVIQLGAALTAGAAFLLTQLPNIAPEAGRHLYRAVESSSGVLSLLGHAAVGELVPLATLVTAAAIGFALATRLAARHLAASADRTTPRRATAPQRLRFRTGMTRIVVVKELRLIARDPELITQLAMRLVYLVPITALILRGEHGIDPAGLAGAMTGFAALLASSLAWIVVCGEDAPDLLASSPTAARTVARSKVLAAGLPPALVVVAAGLPLARESPWTAAVMLTFTLVAITTAALIQTWFGRPAPRSTFRRRQAGSFVVGIGEVALAGSWSSTTTLLARHSAWAVAPALLAATIVAGAIEARRDRA